MDILKTSLAAIQPSQTIGKLANGQASNKDGSQTVEFGDFLKQAIDQVNSMQQQSADMKTQLVTGQIDSIDQVLVAAEKANLAFQLTLQIRNKIIDAYQEVMRMQM